MAEPLLAEPAELPVGPVGERGIGWSGMVMLIASEAALFVYLLFSYYYTGAVSPPPWVLEAHPKLHLALPNTLILLVSSIAIWWGERGMREGRTRQAVIGSGLAFALGLIFAFVQLMEWKAKPYGPGASSYASLYYVTTGMHMAHVLVGLGVLAMLFLWSLLGYFSPRRRLVFTNGAYYWHFVDVVWLFVFTTYYLTPYLGFGT